MSFLFFSATVEQTMWKLDSKRHKYRTQRQETPGANQHITGHQHLFLHLSEMQRQKPIRIWCSRIA